MNKSALFWTLFLCMNFPIYGHSQCFDGDPSENYAAWNPTMAIEENFNAARRAEERDKGFSIGCLGEMSVPLDGWHTYTEEEIVLYIHNLEREARGFLPFYGIESNLSTVAQAHSEWQVSNDYFGHGGDPSKGRGYAFRQCSNCATSIFGSSAFERMNERLPLAGQWQKETENLSVRVTSGAIINNFVAQSIYDLIYVDKSSSWGHRHSVLSVFRNDWGDQATEGFIGVGIAQGNHYEACFFRCKFWNFVKIMTIDYYDPKGSAAGFSFSIITKGL